jgi:hypothetical protein
LESYRSLPISVLLPSSTEPVMTRRSIAAGGRSTVAGIVCPALLDVTPPTVP